MEDLLQKLRAAAEPTRLRILALCTDGELSVTDLTQILGQSQPRVSRHLKVMCDAGLLDRFREGTFAFFRLAEGRNAELARVIGALLPADDAVLALDRERLAAIKRDRARSAAAYFASNAPDWDRVRASHIDNAEVAACLVAALPAQPIDLLIDIGTGTGWVLSVLAQHARRAIGLDSSREMLAVARANLGRVDGAGLSDRLASDGPVDRNVQVRLADLHTLPFAGDSVDVAVMHQVLHYLESPAAALAEVARVLRPGGRVIVVDFAEHTLTDLRDAHAHRWLGFQPQQVADWMRSVGLEPLPPRSLLGDPLTVTIWSADRLATAGQPRDGDRPEPPISTHFDRDAAA